MVLLCRERRSATSPAASSRESSESTCRMSTRAFEHLDAIGRAVPLTCEPSSRSSTPGSCSNESHDANGRFIMQRRAAVKHVTLFPGIRTIWFHNVGPRPGMRESS